MKLQKEAASIIMGTIASTGIVIMDTIKKEEEYDQSR
jgi:hypothetical protein